MSDLKRGRRRKGGFSATWVAAIVVAAVAAYAYFVEYEGGKKKDEQKKKDEIVLRFEAEKSDRLEISSGGKSLVLEKKGDAWRLSQPIADAADSVAVNSLLGQLSSERSQETVAEGKDVDWSKYGLANPVGKVSVHATDGATKQLEIGSKSFDASLYARVTGEDRVILVTSAWDPILAKQAKDLRDKRLYRSDSTSDVDSIEVALPAEKRVARALKKDGKWTFERAEPFPASSEEIESFLRSIKNARAEEFVADDKADRAVVAKMGLSSPRLIVTLKSGDKKTWRASFARAAEAKGKGAKEALKPLQVGATSDDLPGLVMVSTKTAEGLEKSTSDFYDRAAPFRFNPTDAAEILIQTPKLTLEAKRSGADWSLTDASKAALSGKELESAKLQTAIARLSSMRVDAFLAGQKPQGLKPAKNKITVRDSASKAIFEFAWGDEYKDSKSAHAPVGRDGDEEYRPNVAPDASAQRVRVFAESKAGGQSFPAYGAFAGDVDGLGLADVLKDKTPSSAGSSAASSGAPPANAAGKGAAAEGAAETKGQ